MKYLIIDDEALVRRSLARALRAQGHEVVEAVDGMDGLLKWKEQDPDFVFLDVLMPGLTGPQVLEKIGEPRRAKVLMMSAYLGDEDVEKTSRGAADAFLSKPFDDIFAVVAKAEGMLK